MGYYNYWDYEGDTKIWIIIVVEVIYAARIFMIEWELLRFKPAKGELDQCFSDFQCISSACISE